MKIESQSKVTGLPHHSDVVNLALEVNLPSSEHLLLHVLRSRMSRKQKSCWPTQKELAKEMGISVRQVQRLIQSVKDKGIISVEKRKRNEKYKVHNQNEDRFIFPWNIDQK